MPRLEENKNKQNQDNLRLMYGHSTVPDYEATKNKKSLYEDLERTRIGNMMDYYHNKDFYNERGLFEKELLNLYAELGEIRRTAADNEDITNLQQQIDSLLQQVNNLYESVKKFAEEDEEVLQMMYQLIEEQEARVLQILEDEKKQTKSIYKSLKEEQKNQKDDISSLRIYHQITQKRIEELESRDTERQLKVASLAEELRHLSESQIPYQDLGCADESIDITPISNTAKETTWQPNIKLQREIDAISQTLIKWNESYIKKVKENKESKPTLMSLFAKVEDTSKRLDEHLRESKSRGKSIEKNLNQTTIHKITERKRLKESCSKEESYRGTNRTIKQSNNEGSQKIGVSPFKLDLKHYQNPHLERTIPTKATISLRRRNFHINNDEKIEQAHYTKSNDINRNIQKSRKNVKNLHKEIQKKEIKLTNEEDTNKQLPKEVDNIKKRLPTIKEKVKVIEYEIKSQKRDSSLDKKSSRDKTKYNEEKIEIIKQQIIDLDNKLCKVFNERQEKIKARFENLRTALQKEIGHIKDIQEKEALTVLRILESHNKATRNTLENFQNKNKEIHKDLRGQISNERQTTKEEQKNLAIQYNKLEQDFRSTMTIHEEQIAALSKEWEKSNSNKLAAEKNAQSFAEKKLEEIDNLLQEFTSSKNDLNSQLESIAKQNAEILALVKVEKLENRNMIVEPKDHEEDRLLLQEKNNSKKEDSHELDRIELATQEQRERHLLEQKETTQLIKNELERVKEFVDWLTQEREKLQEKLTQEGQEREKERIRLETQEKEKERIILEKQEEKERSAQEEKEKQEAQARETKIQREERIKNAKQQLYNTLIAKPNKADLLLQYAKEQGIQRPSRTNGLVFGIEYLLYKLSFNFLFYGVMRRLYISHVADKTLELIKPLEGDIKNPDIIKNFENLSKNYFNYIKFAKTLEQTLGSIAVDRRIGILNILPKNLESILLTLLCSCILQQLSVFALSAYSGILFAKVSATLVFALPSFFVTLAAPIASVMAYAISAGFMAIVQVVQIYMMQLAILTGSATAPAGIAMACIFMTAIALMYIWRHESGKAIASLCATILSTIGLCSILFGATAGANILVTVIACLIFGFTVILCSYIGFKEWGKSRADVYSLQASAEAIKKYAEIGEKAFELLLGLTKEKISYIPIIENTDDNIKALDWSLQKKYCEMQEIVKKIHQCPQIDIAQIKLSINNLTKEGERYTDPEIYKRLAILQQLLKSFECAQNVISIIEKSIEETRPIAVCLEVA